MQRTATQEDAASSWVQAKGDLEYIRRGGTGGSNDQSCYPYDIRDYQVLRFANRHVIALNVATEWLVGAACRQAQCFSSQEALACFQCEGLRSLGKDEILRGSYQFLSIPAAREHCALSFGSMTITAIVLVLQLPNAEVSTLYTGEANNHTPEEKECLAQCTAQN